MIRTAEPTRTRPAARRAPVAAAAFFDVDETLIGAKSMFRFLEHYWRAVGRPDQDYLDTWDRFAGYPAAGVTREQSNRLFYRLFAGDEVAEVHRHGARWFAAALARGDLWNPSGTAAFRRHRAAGHLTVLVSGSFPPCLHPLADALGADLVLCSRPEQADGRYTGELAEPMIGDAKALAARALMAEHGLAPADCHAYGDHPSDLPLLEQVGHPVVVGDDPRLARLAEQRGWTRLP
ncbi:HAD family phosphatase [Streptomyces sp. TLI_171]|uniref:HAD family hydrolase n=1 Tax=Streptomyces sp. TLI_171 TaxID=1938859 RepID=UPI000C18C2A1|nr:HAD family hydrolase [Streptomyces sp. TLI_171]RKE20780.1 HAD superfamily hydrolase (TIGR01490 family) [Streptomyces sp. TLI_171]